MCDVGSGGHCVCTRAVVESLPSPCNQDTVHLNGQAQSNPKSIIQSYMMKQLSRDRY